METRKTWWLFLFNFFIFQICKTPEIKKDVLDFHMHVWKGSFSKKMTLEMKGSSFLSSRPGLTWGCDPELTLIYLHCSDDDFRSSQRGLHACVTVNQHGVLQWQDDMIALRDWRAKVHLWSRCDFARLLIDPVGKSNSPKTSSMGCAELSNLIWPSSHKEMLHSHTL